MAARLLLSNGLVEIDLLDDAGFAVLYGQWSPGSPQPDVEEVVKAIGQGGASLANTSFDNVTERMDLKLKGTSHDDIAAQLHQLEGLLEQAADHQEEPTIYDPVHLVAKTDDESNHRYVEILYGSIQFKRNWRDMPFVHSDVWLDVQLMLRRKPFWHGVSPQTIPDRTNILGEYVEDEWANAGEELVVVGNTRQTSDLTHIFNYDDNLTAFSANLINDAAIEPFVVSGSTPANGDIMYLGSQDGPFFNVVMKPGTLGDFVAGWILEYWNGAAWTTAVANLHSSFLEQSTLNDGGGTYGTINWNNPSGDWATTGVNGVTAYWLRVRINSFTSWTSNLVLAELVRCANNNYIEIGESQIQGTVRALAMMRLHEFCNSAAGERITLVAMGAKSRNLDVFESMINAGGENPAGWSITNHSDTTIVASTEAPGAQKAECTFSGNQSVVQRLRFVFSSVDSVKYAGAYRVYLRCRQTSGTAGDVQVRMDLDTGATVRGELINLKDADEGIELVDMGRFTIFPDTPRHSEEVGGSFGTSLAFELYAGAPNSTPNLDIFGIVLIPVDEWSMVATHFSTDVMSPFTALQLDGGIIREDAHLLLHYYSAIPTRRLQNRWQVRGELPVIKQKRQTRIYFLFAAQSNLEAINEAPFGLNLAVELRIVPRWRSLRGAT